MTSENASKELIDLIPHIEADDSGYDKTGTHLELVLEAGNLKAAVQTLKDRDYYLEDLTARDEGDFRQMVYRLNILEGPHRVTLRADLGADDAVDSIAGLYAAARWQERECAEFFGVVFTGNPDTRKLLLPEDADFHPLRKDFVVPDEALAPEYKQD